METTAVVTLLVCFVALMEKVDGYRGSYACLIDKKKDCAYKVCDDAMQYWSTCYKDCTDGGWSDFSSWTQIKACTRTCGSGKVKYQRERKCDSPSRNECGKFCTGPGVETNYNGSCNIKKCPINGGWSIYTPWETVGECPVTCEGNKTLPYTRSRTCTQPVPSADGKPCIGDANEAEDRKCNSQRCPVDGGWSGYSEWASVKECSVSCGGGATIEYTRSRTCTNPTPVGNGKQCSGKAMDTNERICNPQHCPVDGGWSIFSNWETFQNCSVTCGDGKLSFTRLRTCTNPRPAYNGAHCTGKPSEKDVRACNSQHCPVNGGWSRFRSWYTRQRCPVTCGGGRIRYTRRRTCTNPRPAYRGRWCRGRAWQSTIWRCNTKKCPRICVPRSVFPDYNDYRNFFQCSSDGTVVSKVSCKNGEVWLHKFKTCGRMPSIEVIAP